VSHISHAMSDLAMISCSQQREAALAGLHQSGDHAQQGALTGAVITQHYIQAPRRKAGRDAADGGKPAKKFHQIIENNDRRRREIAGARHAVRFRDSRFQPGITGPACPAVPLDRLSAHFRWRPEPRPVALAFWERTSRRTWLECWWHGRRHRVQIFLPP